MIREDLKQQIKDLENKIKTANENDKIIYQEMIDYLKSLLEEMELND